MGDTKPKISIPAVIKIKLAANNRRLPQRIASQPALSRPMILVTGRIKATILEVERMISRLPR